MQDPRSSQTDHAAERELHERVGYVRCEVDAARGRLRELERIRDDLLRKKQELVRQVEFVQRDVDERRRELAERLGSWCALDDLDQRTIASDFIRKVDAVRTSRTYRITAGVLHVVNRVRYYATFRWLRGPSPR
ncbi:MAG: hypothetical protein JNK78_03835 [Planctomycetes bacterium]|nr:hypothetical protein [Planctomycetota bacterium]